MNLLYLFRSYTRAYIVSYAPPFIIHLRIVCLSAINVQFCIPILNNHNIK